MPTICKGKDLAEEAKALIKNGVTNREAFMAAVPLVVECLDKAKSFNKFVRNLNDAAAKLGALAAEYAKSHPTALDNELHTERDGIISGLVMINEVNYRLTLSKGDPKRESGDNLTAKFLGSLPPAWTKSKLELSVTALNDLEVTDTLLADYDLVRPEKVAWSVVDESECEC